MVGFATATVAVEAAGELMEQNKKKAKKETPALLAPEEAAAAAELRLPEVLPQVAPDVPMPHQRTSWQRARFSFARRALKTIKAMPPMA